MRVLLDENLPHALRYHLSHHDIMTAAYGRPLPPVPVQARSILLSMRLAWVFLFFSLACSGRDSRYEQLMKDILIFDEHIDTPRLFLDENYRLADRHSYYELDLPRLREGHVGAVLFGIYAQPQ